MNKQPNPDIFYIYNHTMAWNGHLFDSITTVKIGDVELPLDGLLVSNVSLDEHGNYFFKFVGCSDTFETRYGWSFIENTERGMESFHSIKDLRDKIKNIQFDIKVILDRYSLA